MQPKSNIDKAAPGVLNGLATWLAVLLVFFAVCPGFGQASLSVPRRIIYDRELKTWHVFYVNSASGPSYIDYFNPDGPEDNVPFIRYGAGNDVKAIRPDSSEKLYFVSYGNTPLISIKWNEGERKDTIVYSKRTRDVAYKSLTKGFAIVEGSNDSVYFATTDKEGAWKRTAEQLLVRKKERVSVTGMVHSIYSLIACAAALIVLILWVSTRDIKRRIASQRKKDKAEESLFTNADHALGINDRDLLGFSSIEQAVINVIRNPKTSLPLTLVISGKWGSGKSSMMNRIRQKLETDPETKGRFLTTWFNAWHLQGENNLLNTFLISLAKFYERSFMAFFRLRLLVIRLLKLSVFKQFLFFTTLTVTVCILTALFYKIFILTVFKGRVELIDTYIHNVKELVQGWGAIQKEGQSFFVIMNVIAGAISIFSVIFLRKELKPWGLNTFTELLNLQKFKADAESQQPGHREKFKEDFWDILKASGKSKTTVIFIDDIDRIPGDKVLELLEAINFISDTASTPGADAAQALAAGKRNPAKMVFVMAMATEEVAFNLGKRLADLNGSAADKKKLGLNYIEKMVQLVVSVPFDESNEELRHLTNRIEKE